MAEAERETIAERTMNGKLSKAMDGYMVYGRYYPYGYRAKHDGK
jgi:DNA invertase Pin-like site-specific DNA recombinase